MIQKTEGWESRLNDYFEKMRLVPFKRGQHDCALFAGHCIDIMTGADTTTEFLSKPYKSRKEAFEMLKSLGYDDLAAIATKKLGETLPAPEYAQRGDCVLIEHEKQQALGIVDLSGRRAVTIGKEGFMFYPMKNWVMAWKV